MMGSKGTAGWARSFLPLALVLITVVLTITVYLPSLQAPFYFDDLPNVVDPPVIRSAELTIDSMKSIASSAWIPRRFVANLSFALNHIFGGPDPRSFHLVNLFIHLAVGLALAWLIRLYLSLHATRGKDSNLTSSVAFLAALLFLVHPLNIQAVTYVVQRMASLAAFFVVLSFACFLKYRGGSTRVRPVYWITLASLAWIAGIFTKENAFVFPLVAVTYESAFHRDVWIRRLKRAWRAPHGRVLVLVGLVVASAMVPVAVTVYGGSVNLNLFDVMSGREFTGFQRVLTQARVQTFYLSLLVWPSPSRLNLYHEFGVSHSLLDPPSTMIAVGFWLAVFVGVFFLTFRRPLYGFPLAAYIIFHLMESGPLNLELVFEHRMYLPMTMLALFMATVMTESQVPVRRVLVAGLSIATAVMAIATYQRNTVWADPITFFSDCARKSPDNFRATFTLGTELAKGGRYADAEVVLKKAAALDTDNSGVHNQLGNVYLLTEDFGSAHHHYERSVELAPDNAAALYNLARLDDRLGRTGAAIMNYRRFLTVVASQPHLAPKVDEVSARIHVLSSGR
jgi:hypothetical protein